MKQMNPFFPGAALVCALFFALSSLPAQAEANDRQQPIHLEADQMDVDDIEGTQVLTGHVTLTQGTLVIRSDRIVITEDPYGFQHGTAYGGSGGLARFRQKRDDGAWVEGEGERIEYNTRNEVAELFQRAWIKNGEDELRGDYLWYDGLSARYRAATGKDEEGKRPGRVSATLQPKTKEFPAAAEETPADLPDHPAPR
ncbi:MAG: lipopolysaccharide transport periplasmic protein LptA [Zoogloeaceae bacterium]|jgi:lipopolysaccharide export system protein LptA|nr:lipopolysaccharide transport periplasmic protein LptA [Zoogloeaceae bacterium]